MPWGDFSYSVGRFGLVDGQAVPAFAGPRCTAIRMLPVYPHRVDRIKRCGDALLPGDVRRVAPAAVAVVVPEFEDQHLTKRNWFDVSQEGEGYPVLRNEFMPVLDGDFCLRGAFDDRGEPQEQVCRTMAEGEVFVHEASVFLLRYLPERLATDFGPQPTYAMTHDGLGTTYSSRFVDWEPLDHWRHIIWYYLLPTKITMDIGPSALSHHSGSTDLVPGEITTFTFDPEEERGWVHVHPPQRDLPDVDLRRCNSNVRARHHVFGRRDALPQPIPNWWVHGVQRDPVELALLDPERYRAFPINPVLDGDWAYGIEVYGLESTFEIAAEETTDVYFKRIDVEDVRITGNQTGEVEFVPGVYELFTPDQNGSVALSNW